MSADQTLTILVPVGLSSDSSINREPDAAAMLIALSLQDQGNKREVVAVSSGGSCAEEALLAALARGASRGVLAKTQTDDPRSASLLLASLTRNEKPDLIIFSDRASKDPACQIGPRLAAILGWPHASGVLDIEIASDKQCRIVRDLGGRRERLDLALPAVLGVSVDENDVPLLSLYDIIAARNKPIKRMKGASLASRHQSGFTVLKSEPAGVRRKGRMVSDVDELLAALREEAHVI